MSVYVCPLYVGLCALPVCVYQDVCMRNRAGGHVPCGAPYSPQSRKHLHQTDYSTATMTAFNGRNKTPSNEDTNLRNITLHSEI